MESRFRSEIAGLRAVAVVSVVLFHLKLGSFQGGFVGVDIFFVISGYLITRNILHDLRENRFSIGQFYVRRTRRIYPALIFTVVVTYIAGALWCSPEMFLDLAKECTHALLSISNIQYWRESYQYFAASSDDLALLHCWSLSLEEQFYLFWPIFIVLAQKAGRVFIVIVVAAVASFAASIIVAKADPLAAFFLMPFRIFEFAGGALILRLEKTIKLNLFSAELLSISGILAIGMSVALFNSDMPHLDVAILLPCLGAVATILAGNKTRSSKLLVNGSMISLGGISYSLYLCHWPMIFFARFIFGGDSVDTLAGTFILISAMIAVAVVMNLWIERPFRYQSGLRSASFRNNAAVFGSLILALAAITHITFLSKGFASRIPKTQLELAHLQDLPSSQDMIASKRVLRFELAGDSHATHYIAGLSQLATQLDVRFDALTAAGCPLLYGVTLKNLRKREFCQMWRDQTLKSLEHTDLPLIFSQRWEIYNDQTADFELFATESVPPHEDALDKLQLAIENMIKKIGARRILIIGDQVKAGCQIDRPRLLEGPLPHAPLPPCPPTERSLADQSTSRIDQMLSRIQAKWPDRIELIRPVDYFCDSSCPVVKDGIWLYFERTHFSVAGSQYMVARADDVFRKFIEK
jgi:peptidoglycan/LPS O-acetylase OafA/YrhL